MYINIAAKCASNFEKCADRFVWIVVANIELTTFRLFLSTDTQRTVIVMTVATNGKNKNNEIVIDESLMITAHNVSGRRARQF